MRRLSLNARLAADDQAPDQIEVVLIEVSHPDLPQPVRLSTDNTERLSADPLYYGTRSTWRGADPVSDPYLWVVAEALLPSDQEDTPASAQIVLENLDAEMARLMRSFTTPATVALAVVLADTPDLIEVEFADLRLVQAEIDAGQIALTLSREEIELEYFPGGRMTRQRFPGLHR